MNLADYQRAFVRASMALEPSEADLGVLGDVAKSRMYRSMIRSRLLGMARQAFRLSEQIAGQAEFADAFSRFLADVSPRSPYLRDVIAEFGAFALGGEPCAENALLRDMFVFELAKWRAAYALAPRPQVGDGAVREFDFEGVPVLNPVLHCLELEFAVHEPERPARPTRLLVYRPPALDQVRWYATEPYFYALVARLRGHEEPFVASVRHTAEALGIALDQALIEQLSSAVTLALTRQVLIGSREHAALP